MAVNNRFVGSDYDDLLKKELKNAKFRKRYEKARLTVAVGQIVKRIMAQKKLSSRQLAAAMDVSTSQVQRLLKDENVTVSTLAKFAAATDKAIEIKIK